MAIHPLYLMALLVVFLVVFGAAIAVIVLVLRNQRRTPMLSHPASNQAVDGSWISADGRWRWDGQAWVPRSEEPPGS
jgi:hypothetical protein